MFDYSHVPRAMVWMTEVEFQKQDGMQLKLNFILLVIVILHLFFLLQFLFN